MHGQLATRRRKAIGPVIAYIIVITVAIIIALAYGFWASGIMQAFQQTERLEARLVSANEEVALIHLTNKGSEDITVTDIIVTQGGAAVDIEVEYDGEGDDDLGCPTPTCDSDGLAINKKIPPGQTAEWDVIADAGYQRGASYDISVVTASGNTLTVTVFIP